MRHDPLPSAPDGHLHGGFFHSGMRPFLLESDMTYTFKQMLAIENTANSAIRAGKCFATGDESKNLNHLNSLVAELRHAAGLLVNASDEDRQLVAQRLISLFKEEPAFKAQRHLSVWEVIDTRTGEIQDSFYDESAARKQAKELNKQLEAT